MVGRWRALVRVVAIPVALIAAVAAPPAASAADSGSYVNPLEPIIPAGGIVESCADPTILRGQEEEGRWYMYCTSDPLNDEDRTASGFRFRLIPQLVSEDLVDWTYVGDAFTGRPAYATATAGIWAPEVEYHADSGKYHLYYTVTETTLSGGGSAIGVATSDGPTGPWTHSAAPVVEPHGADCCGPESRRWVYDPEVLQTPGTDYIYYGSYFGGISVRELTPDLLTSVPATQTNVAVANKYEGAEVIKRRDWYYLWVSATDCCRGPLTGYAVFVGRSASPIGPFLDRSGVDLNDDERLSDETDGRAGGSPTLVGRDGDWVGTGHNTVFEDLAGQWWTIYHAIDPDEPYFENGVDIFPGNCDAEGQTEQPCGDLNKRPPLLDAVDWLDGWPTINGGIGISTTPQPAPAAQPGQTTAHEPRSAPRDEPGDPVASATDEFSRRALDRRWTWVRRPQPRDWTLADGRFRMTVQEADLFVDSDSASILLRDAPDGDYVVETRVRLHVPAEGCCYNYVQAGLVLYANDDDYLKLVHASIWNTRQTEWAKELAPVPEGYPRYGNSIVGPPGGVVTTPTASPLGEWTRLRIVRRTIDGTAHYTAYTRAQGGVWERGMTWIHDLGAEERIGVVAMGRVPPGPAGGPPPELEITAEFDYVRVWRLEH